MRNHIATLMVAALGATALWLAWIVVGHPFCVPAQDGLATDVIGSTPWFRATAVWLSAFLVALLPAWRVAPILVARYDTASLTPPSATDASAMLSTQEKQVIAALLQWSGRGASVSGAPVWAPWKWMTPPLPLSAAIIKGGSEMNSRKVVEAYCREIDGSNRLDRCSGTLSRLGLRAWVKVCDCLWWRSSQPSDPWDSGYLKYAGDAQGAKGVFAPRRATCIVIGLEPCANVERFIARLTEGSPGLRYPVRLLIVETDEGATGSWRSPALELPGPVTEIRVPG